MLLLLLLVGATVSVHAADWPSFRGPNASGLGAGSGPEDLSLANLRWKKALPKSASSPIVAGGRVVVNVLEGETLSLVAFNGSTGEEVWRVEPPRPRREKHHPQHGPESPSPAFDGRNLYVFFPDFGLLSYTIDGEERWRRPLGPFTSVQGLGGSPVVADGKVVLLVDQAFDAFVATFDAGTGKEIWRRQRPTNFLGGYSTPVIYRPSDGPAQVIVAGSVELTAYQLATGERLWWSGGSMAPVSAPVLAGDRLFLSEPLNQAPPAFSGMKPMDRNGDGSLSREEAAAVSGLVHLVDRVDGDHGNGDGTVDEAEWNRAFDDFLGSGGLRAIQLGGEGNVTDSALLWRFDKSLPYLPSILHYQELLYVVRDGGILTALDAETGEVVKQGRLREALGQYYASPVAADGKIYLADMDGKVSIVRAGKDWDVLSTAELGAPIQSTPAIADGRIYVRTHEALYCFGA